MPLLSVQFTRVLPYLEFKVLIGYRSLFPAILAITRTYPPLVEEAGLLSTSLYQRRQRCYHSLWSSLHLWGHLMKQRLTSPGSSYIKCSRLFPFSCSTFSKSSFCYKQALGQRHQSPCQCLECITLSFLRACRAWRTIHVSASSSQNCTSGTGSLITLCLLLVAQLVFGCRTRSPWSSCRVCF